MKKRIVLLLALVCLLNLASCGGNVRKVNRSEYASEIYTDAKIESAIDTAIAYLHPEGKRIPVFLAGGITAKSDVIFPIMEKHLQSRCQLIRLTEAPVEGAVRRAQAIYKAKTKNTFSTMNR